ncbi:MAG: pantetheine-phosphate adenylyltransferase [Candidatus Binatus sp.]|uniref:pantetheine-phosphate adenylyltransferase n=1 Tax=Candidatus Binatus sp. TaxID=2811406 RepID=UPI00271628C1|nr:pantetheine-phosphate adenylyltransferase [Candidatus Binatus sp.]MDO8431677.1 pantetheine-phosphate adenylyltransferase [Candidatus Binatus sp.]
MANRTKERAPLIAVYPGSFDPIHNGHIDVIRRSVLVFDEVIVAVTYNPHKDTALFSADERVEIIREVIHDLEPRARVDKFSGLSVDYAERIGAKVLLRSLRSVTDFDYEMEMTQMNKKMAPNIETVFMFSDPKLFFTASRLIKEVASYGKRVPELVPELVMTRLRSKLKLS